MPLCIRLMLALVFALPLLALAPPWGFYAAALIVISIAAPRAGLRLPAAISRRR